MAPTIDDVSFGRVAAALVLQVLGYAAMLALFPHGDPTGVVDALTAVPAVVLIPLAVPAIPATVLTLAVGAVLGAAGLPLEAFPAVLLTGGDVVFFVCALAVAVVAAWADERAADLA